MASQGKGMKETRKVVLSGKPLSQKIRKRVKKRVDELRRQYGRVPHLVMILIGHDPASASYVRGKVKACGEVGIKSTIIHRDESIGQEELLWIIRGLDEDPDVSGILVQLPLPDHIVPQDVIYTMDPSKDVDGFHPINVGNLYIGGPCLAPCTPKGIMALLVEGGVQLEGKHAVVVGRSRIVGHPVAEFLLKANATVTTCHRKTKNLAEVTQRGEILIVAAGAPLLIKASMVKRGAVVVDVGISRLPNGRLVGDVDFDEVAKVASLITPVPGGVGPMTITSLMENTLEAFERQLSRASGNC